jgi:hypothetical protein
VHRGTPADSTTIDVLKANGIRWSPRIETRHLPSTLRPENRDAKVRAVTRALGHAIGLEETDGGSRQSAHYDAAPTGDSLLGRSLDLWVTRFGQTRARPPCRAGMTLSWARRAPNTPTGPDDRV